MYPLDDRGQAALSVTVRLEEEEEDQDEVETQPVPIHETGPPLSGFLGPLEGVEVSAAGGQVESSQVEPVVDAITMTQADDTSTGPAMDSS